MIRLTLDVRGRHAQGPRVVHREHTDLIPKTGITSDNRNRYGCDRIAVRRLNSSRADS